MRLAITQLSLYIGSLLIPRGAKFVSSTYFGASNIYAGPTLGYLEPQGLKVLKLSSS